MTSEQQDIRELLRSLKQWQKAIRQLRKKGKSPAQRQQQLQKAQQAVMRALEMDTVDTQLKQLITTAASPDAANVDDLREVLIRDAQPLILVELRSVHPLPLRRKDLETIIDSFLRKSAEPAPIANTQELRDCCSKLQILMLQTVDEIAPLSRKAKKKRHRDLTQSTLHAVVGLGLLAGNTLVPHETAQYSYILGGNALLMAMRFLVGSREA